VSALLSSPTDRIPGITHLEGENPPCPYIWDSLNALSVRFRYVIFISFFGCKLGIVPDVRTVSLVGLNYTCVG
jgi:hypothetical protein